MPIAASSARIGARTSSTSPSRTRSARSTSPERGCKAPAPPADLDGAGDNRIEPDVDLRLRQPEEHGAVHADHRHHDRPVRHPDANADQAGVTLLPGAGEPELVIRLRLI